MIETFILSNKRFSGALEEPTALGETGGLSSLQLRGRFGTSLVGAGSKSS
jgi:hypothetical protein